MKISKITKLIVQHKFISAVVILVIIAGIYFGFKGLTGNKSAVRYVTASVEKGTLIVSVSGTGQVNSSEQIDIKPKVSGDIVSLGVKNGDEIKSGILLAQIDATDAKRAVRDAEINLENTQVQLEELLEPPDELTLLQAENSLVKAQESKQKAEDNIVAGYEDAFNDITNAFFDLPTIISDLNTVLYSYEISDSGEKSVTGYWNISALKNSINVDNQDELERLIKIAESDYKAARTKYDANFKNYKNTSRYSKQKVIEALLEETLETTRAMAETVKSEINVLDFWVDSRFRRSMPVFSVVTGYQSDLKSHTSKTNSYLSSMLSIQRSFQDDRQALLDAEYSIKEKELSLADLKEGATDLEIRTKKIAVQQKEDALNTAKENLAGCYIYAPFDGLVAETYIKKGDSVSSGTKLLTLVTKQKIAEITLNEVDVSKVKTGQKATITFDAVSDLTITGEVVEVDAIGTASQGVVNYGVKIAFDTQDERIKPGMSISTAIITDAKSDVLLVPNSAIKQQGNTSYVQLLNEGTDLRTQQVQTGLSNDTMAEVTDGLKEGDIVVTQTITSTSTSTQNQSQQNNRSLRMPGMF